MVEYTEEEIQKIKEFEQEKAAYDTALRFALRYMESISDEYEQNGNLVKRGMIDGYVYRVFAKKCGETYRTYFPPVKPVEEKKADGE